MNKFSKELGIIPAAAWMLATLAGVCMFCVLFLFGMPPARHPWPLPGQVLFCLAMAIVIFAYVMLIGYINADAKRRGMRYVMWTLLAIFLPNSIGIILYFVLRDPLLIQCAHCGAAGRAGFVFCPQCGSDLCPICPRCRRSIEPAWKKCAYCGADVGPTVAASGPKTTP